MHVLTAAGVLCLMVAGCAAATSGDPDLDAESEAIRELEREWFAAENRRDVQGSLAFWSQDAVLHTSGGDRVASREAFRTLYAALLANLIEVQGGPSQVVVSRGGDLAFTLGSERITFKTPEGTVERQLRYLMVYQKIAGRWIAVAGSTTPLRPSP